MRPPRDTCAGCAGPCPVFLFLEGLNVHMTLKHRSPGFNQFMKTSNKHRHFSFEEGLRATGRGEDARAGP